MSLYLIGIGLHDENDITLKGLEIVKRCSRVYLEHYTSVFGRSVSELESFFGKKIILCPRQLAEEGGERIVEEARHQDVALLIVGDPFAATTHINFIHEGRNRGVLIYVVHNASILTAVGITGLQLYKFGRTTSIPFPMQVPDVETFYDVIKENKEHGAHTLVLLDLHVDKRAYMTISEGLALLEMVEEKRRGSVITKSTLVVGCGRLGADDFVVRAGTIEHIKKSDFGGPPHCFIVPGKLHFAEEEALGVWN